MSELLFEIEDGETETVTTPQVEVEFAIPIYDTGKARMRKAELSYLQAANVLAEKAVNVRSEARGAEASYHAANMLGGHFSVITTLKRSIPALKKNLKNYGLYDNCVSLSSVDIPVLELESNLNLTEQKIEEKIKENFDHFKWNDDQENFKAWTKGNTGYPIVDAAMKELWNTGWMHNRARMITASFFISLNTLQLIVFFVLLVKGHAIIK